MGWRAPLAEGIGTAALVAVVIGSGIQAESLSGGNVGLALLANTIATGAGLIVLITTLGPRSGAHFNPVVTGLMAARRELPAPQAGAYLVAQLVGGVIGAWAAHAMFDLPILQASTHPRASVGLWVAEILATAGLVATILLGRRTAPDRVPTLVAAWIVAAYGFTASTSFANPAVTFARAWTDTFAGIRPTDVAGFVVAQVVGACLGAAVSAAIDLETP